MMILSQCSWASALLLLNFAALALASGALSPAFIATRRLGSACCLQISRSLPATSDSPRKLSLFSAVDDEQETKTTSSIHGAASLSPNTEQKFLEQYQKSLREGQKWAEEFGFANDSSDGLENDGKRISAEGSFYAIFRAIRTLDSQEEINAKLLGLTGTPFYVPASMLRMEESKFLSNSYNQNIIEDGKKANSFSNFFHFEQLATALEEDFLDASRGSTDNRKGWKASAVSEPTGSSFDEARMTLPQVQKALESGTVIFNNIGAHIPRLAGAALASTDALSLPGGINMYVTAKNMRTSAPPHTDRQDVLIVQMEGAKRWRVFSPPTDGNVLPTADPFARGKEDDDLPLHTLLEGENGRLGTKLLLDVVTREGDVLFIPAGMPHTTDTVDEITSVDYINENYNTSIHLTFNIDTHIWELDYLSLRKAALQRNGLKDVLLVSQSNDVSRYTGKVNQLPANLREKLMNALPLEFLDTVPDDNPEVVHDVANELSNICAMVDDVTATSIDSVTLSHESLKETILRIHDYGSTIREIHRDMYLAAIDEGRLRETEAAMTAHLKSKDSSSGMAKLTPERMKRLSLFRVKPFFENIGEVKEDLATWCSSGKSLREVTSDFPSNALDANWPFTSPLKVGDEVEADLGGAFFSAKVSQIVGNKFNVIFFDGDRGDGLERDQIKLLNPPPPSSDEIDTTGLTPKEIKRLKKKMGKKKNR